MTHGQTPLSTPSSSLGAESFTASEAGVSDAAAAERHAWWVDHRVRDWIAEWRVAAKALDDVARLSYEGAAYAGFHDRSDEYEASKVMTLVRIALIGTEVSEAAQAVKKGLGAVEIADELADAVIRIADLAATLGLDLGDAVMRSVKKNAERGFAYNGGLLEGAATERTS